MPLRNHESILIFYEKPPTYNPQITMGTPYRNMGTRPENNGSNYGLYVKKAQNNPGNRQPTSVLDIKSEWNKKGHPTQKPVALLEWLIKTYTNPGDTVLDPVAGSGTTAIAALRTGRHCIAIEKDPAYFEVMRKRVDAERASMGLPPN